MTGLIALHAIPPRVADELTWRWQEADGDMGLHSNFASMIALLERGTSGGGPRSAIAEIDERGILAAAKVRHIDRALARLRERDVDLLFALFGAPVENWAALLWHIPAARRAHASSGSRHCLEDWVAGLFGHIEAHADAPACQVAGAIQRQASVLIACAARSYAEARRLS